MICMCDCFICQLLGKVTLCTFYKPFIAQLGLSAKNRFNSRIFQKYIYYYIGQFCI